MHGNYTRFFGGYNTNIGHRRYNPRSGYGGSFSYGYGSGNPFLRYSGSKYVV